MYPCVEIGEEGAPPCLTMVSVIGYGTVCPSIGPARFLYDFKERAWKDVLLLLYSIIERNMSRLVLSSGTLLRKATADRVLLLDTPVNPQSTEFFDDAVGAGWVIECTTAAATTNRCTLNYVLTDNASSETGAETEGGGEVPRLRCCICLQYAGERHPCEVWQTLAKCGHRFHHTCQERWVHEQGNSDGRGSCGLCRSVSDV